MLKIALDYLREKFPLNRVVLIATATITPFAATVAGVVSAWIADHAPLIAEQVSGPQITAIFITVATTTAAGAITLAYKWAEGWQKHEDRIAQAVNQMTNFQVTGQNSPVAGQAAVEDEPGDDMRLGLSDKPGVGAVPTQGD